jgi:cytochrome c oxidase subunit 4
MSHHVVPKKTYFFVFAVLIVLTIVTTEVAFVDLGPLNTFTALAIATVKMLLVVLFFMHVRQSAPLTKIVVAAGFFWLALLISLTLSDILTRDWTPAPTGWESSEVLLPKPHP